LAYLASAATCGSSVLSALLTSANIQQCGTDTTEIPDQATIDKMCASTACNTLLADVKAMNLEECQLPVGVGSNLKADLVVYVPSNCPSTSAPRLACHKRTCCRHPDDARQLDEPGRAHRRANQDPHRLLTASSDRLAAK
ncbi:elicitin-like protein, partial [Phytophthora infestans T30-4]